LSSLAVTFQALFNLLRFVIPLLLGRLRRYLHLIEGIFSRATKFVSTSEIGRSIGGILAAGRVLSVVPDKERFMLAFLVGVGVEQPINPGSGEAVARKRAEAPDEGGGGGGNKDYYYYYYM
jgi:hypothetical protein